MSPHVRYTATGTPLYTCARRTVKKAKTSEYHEDSFDLWTFIRSNESPRGSWATLWEPLPYFLICYFLLFWSLSVFSCHSLLWNSQMTFLPFLLTVDSGLRGGLASGKLSGGNNCMVGAGGEEGGGGSKALGCGKPPPHHTHTDRPLGGSWGAAESTLHQASDLPSRPLSRLCDPVQTSPPVWTAVSSTVRWGTVEVKYTTVCEDAP